MDHPATTDPPLEDVLVDVSIPTVGRTAFLRGAIEAVLGQTFGGWRLVVSDNGSGSDAVQAVVEPYLVDPRVSFVASEHQVSAAEHFTRLINTGNAPYVALLDDDDLWAPCMLERRVAFLEEHRECAFVFSSMQIIDESGAELKRWRVRLREGVQDQRTFVSRLLEQNVVGGASALVRRTAYAAAGPVFDGRFPRTYDYEMWLRLALVAPVGFLSGFDAAWRYHPEQETRDLDSLEREYGQLVDHAWTLIEARGLGSLLTKRGKRRKLASLLLTGVLNAIERDDRSAALHYLRRAVEVDPWSIFDRRVPFVAAGVVLGGAGRGAVNRARTAAHNHGIRLRL